MERSQTQYLMKKRESIMDENTWRFAQVMMWIIGIQTTVLLAVLGGIWANISDIRKKHEKTDEKISDIDKRVFAIETMLRMKDCCILNSDSQIKKAE